ncbi:hypothetical protein [Lentilitoribacter sp. EG35]|uniref:hypothetical protein n=1 Tax=Lentilitoribacter sp. EG35 TaxID=3234192 RepID=UPI0034608A52
MRLKLIATALLCSTILSSTPASADPITLGAIISTALNAVGASVAIQAVAAQAAVTFASSAIGGAIISAGIGFATNAAIGALGGGGGGGGGGQSYAVVTNRETQGNIKQVEPSRFWLGGVVRKGGNVQFASTKDGEIYKLVAIGDSEVVEHMGWYLGDTLATLDENGNAINDAFTYSGTPYYSIESRNGTSDQVAMQTLIDEFPEWTVNHLGAGTADVLLHVDAVSGEAVPKILRHPGALGLGEVDISQLARFGRYYDPRNDSTVIGGSGTERVDDQSTWGPNLGNPVLMVLAHKIDVERFAMDPSEINWVDAISKADICDESVIDRYGNNINRYVCGITINKQSESNISAEKRILSSCDGIIKTDSDGLLIVFPGKFEAEPSLVFTESDFISISVQDNADGESDVTHIFASYTEPAYGYNNSSSAEYVIDTYEDGDTVKTSSLPLGTVPNHNQAYRILAATMAKETETRKISGVLGQRGSQAKSQLFCRLDFGDDNLSGNYIILNCDDDYKSPFCPVTLIRCNADIWNSAEGNRPNLNITITADNSLTNITPEDMSVSGQEVASAGGSSVRLVAIFTTPSRGDVVAQIEHKPDGSTLWEAFSVRTEDGYGSSAIVSNGSTQNIRWRVVTLSGEASDWSSEIDIDATADITPTSAHSSPDVVFGDGEAVISWINPTETNYGSTVVERAFASTNRGDSTPIRTEFGFAGSVDGFTDTGLSAGSVSYWITPYNKSNIPGPTTGPITGTIT